MGYPELKELLCVSSYRISALIYETFHKHACEIAVKFKLAVKILLSVGLELFYEASYNHFQNGVVFIVNECNHCF